MTRIPPPAPPVVGGTPRLHSGQGNHPITRVVIHSAVMPCEPGRARQLGAMNSTGSSGGSWHYATDPAEAIQCSFDRFVCWHAPPNHRSIGIEMADHPGPVPDEKPGSARWKMLRRSWRWARKPQRRMLRRTAQLTAHLCLAYGLPPRYLKPRQLRAGERGWTTHANVSRAFGQSTHWDPGWWPRWWFSRMVRRYARQIEREHSR